MTDFIHEAPPPENPKPAAPEKPTSEKERQKRVYAYIAVLFTVAFILILWSFLANHRSNQQVIDQLKERMRTNHIMRLKNGDCSIETGFVLSDILTNLERVSDTAPTSRAASSICGSTTSTSTPRFRRAAAAARNTCRSTTPMPPNMRFLPRSELRRIKNT